MSTTRRRAALIADVADRYGIPLHEHPDAGTITISYSSHQLLQHLVMNDPQLSAIGRGYYLFLGGELHANVVPDWTCDPLHVALARLHALAIVPWARPITRTLSRWMHR